ncbi:uncharacterized protein [Macrobrachium rosenbergii]|uniref:uncharacterized protein n=1 Tax=Macrobrachium rosenbergii TaxID=79674 RepID=UPI0034D65601
MAFQILIKKLIAAPVQKGIEFGKVCILEIDASYDGLSAVLSQYREDKLHPVAYASRSLKPHERNMKNFGSRKLELCALKWAVTENFNNDLIDTKCIVYTDNAPLSHPSTAKLDHTEQKWVDGLSVFDTELRFRPGKQNVKADILSRKPREEIVMNEDEVWVAPHEDANFACAIKFSPYFLFFGREPCISIETLGYLEDIYKFEDGDWLGQQCKMQKEVWDLVRGNTQKDWVSKAKPMLAKSRESDLKVGHKVLLRENKIIGTAKLGDKFAWMTMKKILKGYKGCWKNVIIQVNLMMTVKGESDLVEEDEVVSDFDCHETDSDDLQDEPQESAKMWWMAWER